MKKNYWLISSVLTVTLIIIGFAGYRLGLSHRIQSNTSSGFTDPTLHQATQTQDPSMWSIAQGEAATLRHMKAGLKSGDLDPETSLPILYYHDPMVPGRKFESPGKSPFMDMMLVPVYQPSKALEQNTVSVSPRMQQNLGIRTGTVTLGPLKEQLSATGTIAWNDTQEFVVQARTTGFIEKLHVGAEQEPVVKGQALFELYVPDWIAVQQDYILARSLVTPQFASVVQAAKQRMRQAGMSEAQIRRIEKTNQVQKRVTLTAPANGVLTGLFVREGSTVTTSMPLARINDLSTVWVIADIPERYIAAIAEGDAVSIQTEAYPGRYFEGSVQRLSSEVDPATRTRKARIILTKIGTALLPGNFVNILFKHRNSEQPVLQIPEEALIRTGKRTVVLLSENGRYTPIPVQTGRDSKGKVEIISGLHAGQKIVLSGQFLIDSEASLKGIEARLAPQSTDQDAATYSTTAVVEFVDGTVLTLTHPEIPALQWPGMTMDFNWHPTARVTEVVAGDRVEITFQIEDGQSPQIIQLQRHPKYSGEQP